MVSRIGAQTRDEKIVNRLGNKVESYGEHFTAVETEAGNFKERITDVRR